MFYRLPEKYHAVDAHNHVWFKNGELDETRMKDLLTAADLLGIEKICVSVPLVSPSAPVEMCRKANDVTLKAMQYSDRLLGFCRSCTWPGEAAEAFLSHPPVVEEDEDGNPLLVLFEALKWSFRISCHLVIGFLEDTHAPQKKGDM